MLCAIVDNNTVVDIKTITDEEFNSIALAHQLALDITNILPQPQIGWVFNGSSLVTNGNDVWHISKLKFRQRFTTAEMYGIFAAASTDYMIQVLLDNQRVSTYTDLRDPTLLAGLQYLYSKGLLTLDRINTILNTPPTPAEIYQG